MTESTQLQTTENNNTGVVKMEPPPPTSSNSAVASTAASTAATTSPSPSATMEQQQQQQQQQQYALKWNDFQSSILNSFRHLRDEEDFVDVTLACDARSYSAHKVVLSACSPYFRKLLKANPCEHPIVILKDVCADDVENLLSFMYNGEVNVSHEHLSDFLKTAHLLQIRGLADVNGGVYGDALNTNNPKALSESLSNNNLSINLSNKMNFLNKNAQNNSSNNHSGSNIFAPPSLPSATSLTPTNNSLVNSNNSNLNSGHQSNHTPAIQELKASSASPVRKSNNKSNHHWDLNDMENNRHQHLTPPPQKRIKSADLFRAQHGISPERLLIEREFPVAGQHALTRERHRDRDRSRETSRDRERDRERNLEFRESLLGQALENNNGSQHSTQKQHADLASLHAQSAGEDSNSSDTEPSDRGDAQHDGTMDSINGSLDNPRSHSFPSAFLGLQGIPGLLPGPSGIGANDFAVDVQQKFRKLLSAPIKEEIIESLEPDTAQSLVLRRESSQSPSREKLAHTHSPSHSKRHHVKIKRSRSVTSSPTPTSWATTGENNDNNNGFALPPDDDDERSSSACSAISLTMKTSVRHKCENTFYQQLLIKQEQQQQQQQHQQQQQQHEHQQQQYLDDLKQTATVSHHHQQQLTANFFMARNFPELFQNSSAAAVAAAAAAAATASTAAAAAAAAAVANSNNNNNNNNNTTNSNYMLPCPLCETPLEQRLFRQHLDHHYPRDSPVCPVIECGRRFAHPNSVRNHMRIKHTLQWAKMKAMRSSGGPFASTGDFKEKFW